MNKASYLCMSDIDDQAQQGDDVATITETQANEVSSEQLFGDIAAELPEAREDEAPADKPADLPPPEPVDRGIPKQDINGVPYNPELFEPEFKKDGTWKKLRGNGGAKRKRDYLERLAKEKQQDQTKLVLPDESGTVLDDLEREAIAEQQAKAAAAEARKANSYAMTAMGFTVTQVLLGDEWKPQDGEVDMIADHLEPVLEEMQYDGWGPKMNLFMVITGVAAKRVNKPETKSRLNRFWAWSSRKVHGFWWWMRGRKSAETEQAAAHDPYAQPASQSEAT